MANPSIFDDIDRTAPPAGQELLPQGVLPGASTTPATENWGFVPQVESAATLGFGPRIAAAGQATKKWLEDSGHGWLANAVFGPGAKASDYDEALARLNETQGGWQAAHPYQNYAADIIGGSAPMALASEVAGGAPLIEALGPVAKTFAAPTAGGGLTGLIQGWSGGEDLTKPDWGNIVESGLLNAGGALASVPLQYLGGKVVAAGLRKLGLMAPKPPVDLGAPSPEDLQSTIRQQATALKNDPTQYLRRPFADTVNGLTQSLGPDVDEKLTPTASMVMTRLYGLTSKDAPIKPGDIETVRQLLNKKIFGGGSPDSDLAVSAKIKTALDNFVKNAGPDDVVPGSGDPAQVAKLYQDAHANEAGSAKAAEQAEPMITAEGKKALGRDADMALKSQFQKLIDADRIAMREGRPPRFSDSQREAMQATIDSPFEEEAARYVGRFTPEKGEGFLPWFGNTLAAGVGALGGHMAGGGETAAAGGFGGPMALTAAAYAARSAASRMLQGRAALAEALTRAQTPLGQARGALQAIPVRGPVSPTILSPGAQLVSRSIPAAWQWAFPDQSATP
jgi:hypothetical protein